VKLFGQPAESAEPTDKPPPPNKRLSAFGNDYLPGGDEAKLVIAAGLAPSECRPAAPRGAKTPRCAAARSQLTARARLALTAAPLANRRLGPELFSLGLGVSVLRPQPNGAQPPKASYALRPPRVAVTCEDKPAPVGASRGGARAGSRSALRAGPEAEPAAASARAPPASAGVAADGPFDLLVQAAMDGVTTPRASLGWEPSEQFDRAAARPADAEPPPPLGPPLPPLLNPAWGVPLTGYWGVYEHMRGRCGYTVGFDGAAASIGVACPFTTPAAAALAADELARRIGLPPSFRNYFSEADSLAASQPSLHSRSADLWRLTEETGALAAMLNVVSATRRAFSQSSKS
jgi:hypothetical protein